MFKPLMYTILNLLDNALESVELGAELSVFSEGGVAPCWLKNDLIFD